MAGRKNRKVATLVEQTAQLLRSACKTLVKRRREPKDDLAPSNKISQIARMLREEISKRIKKK